MRIAINLLYLLPGISGGTETYAAGLLEGFSRVSDQSEILLFVNQESAEWPLPSSARFRRIVCPVAASSRQRRYWYEQRQFPRLLESEQVALVHSLGYVGPLFAKCPAVVTIPDLNFRNFGELMPWHRRLALSFFVEQSARRSRHIIAISEFARGQIVSAFAIPPEKITVTHLAPRTRPAGLARPPDSPAGGSPYILAFSSGSPHKNMPRLVEAFHRARQDRSLEHHLVLVGHPPQPAPNSLFVHCLGYVEDAAVQSLLQGAQLLVFPSTYEGFGLPVLEAMAANVPVVCSQAASLPEVAGDAAVFFDPFSVEDMAAQIGRVAADPALREALRHKGRLNLTRFCWEKTARETLGVYRRVLG